MIVDIEYIYNSEIDIYSHFKSSTVKNINFSFAVLYSDMLNSQVGKNMSSENEILGKASYISHYIKYN